MRISDWSSDVCSSDLPQPEEGVTYAAKIDKAEARIDFTHDANFIERQIRALNPVPGAFFEYRGERFRVHAAHIEHASGTPGKLIDDSLLIACGQGEIGRESCRERVCQYV